MKHIPKYMSVEKQIVIMSLLYTMLQIRQNKAKYIPVQRKSTLGQFKQFNMSSFATVKPIVPRKTKTLPILFCVNF